MSISQYSLVVLLMFFIFVQVLSWDQTIRPLLFPCSNETIWPDYTNKLPDNTGQVWTQMSQHVHTWHITTDRHTNTRTHTNTLKCPHALHISTLAQEYCNLHHSHFTFGTTTTSNNFEHKYRFLCNQTVSQRKPEDFQVFAIKKKLHVLISSDKTSSLKNDTEDHQIWLGSFGSMTFAWSTIIFFFPRVNIKESRKFTPGAGHTSLWGINLYKKVLPAPNMAHLCKSQTKNVWTTPRR